MEKQYLMFMDYLIKMIDEIGSVLQDSKLDENLVKKLSSIILNPEYRIQLGVLIILISFIIYIVSVL
jgi:hypothetical protein|tara:strand:+ start:343 stop:543 length:201 start_codon:yes stop_codon:yes gene_type:complete